MSLEELFIDSLELYISSIVVSMFVGAIIGSTVTMLLRC